MPLSLEVICCPNCFSNHSSNIFTDHRIAGQLGKTIISVGQCDNCGFIFNTPRPTLDEIDRFYSSAMTASGQIYQDESSQGHYPKLMINRAQFLNNISSINKNLKALDIGCGNGGFIKAVKTQFPNLNISGIDPSLQAVKNCINANLDVSQNGVEDLGSSGIDCEYDLISIISVLEHIPNPKLALTKIFQSLKNNGYLFVEVPNTLDPELSLNGFFNIEHIIHFTPFTLIRLLKEIGFNSFKVDLNNANVIRVLSSKEKKTFNKLESPLLLDDRQTALDTVKNYKHKENNLIGEMLTRVTATLMSWKESNKKIAIYGAGLHTQELASRIELDDLIDIYIDGDPNKEQLVFLGKKICSPSAIKENNIDAILISSGRFIDEMKATAIKYGGKELLIETCYG